MTHQIFTFNDPEFRKIIRQAAKEGMIEVLSEMKNEHRGKVKHVSRKEAAKQLGISLPTLHNYTKSGKVHAYRIGGKVRYKINDLEDCLKKIEIRS